MPLQTSGSISAYDGRKEALKTTWVNPNYPNAPAIRNSLDVAFFTNRNIDTRGQAGLNPDGSWSYDKLFGWSTWTPAKIKHVRVHQFDSEGDLRVTWRVEGGDVFRTGYVVKIKTNGIYETSLGTSSDIVRHGGEFNPSASDLKLKYGLNTSGGAQYMQACTPANWYDISAFGDYHVGSVAPASGSFPDPSSSDKNLTIDFSAVFTGLPYRDESNLFAVSIIPIDGRQFHTLDNVDEPFPYTVNTPNSGTDYGNYLTSTPVQATYDPSYNYFSSRAGDEGVIRIFNSGGNFELKDASTTQLVVDVENVYNYYLRGLELFRWIYVVKSVNNETVGTHPYYPDSSGLPSGHVYAGTGTDDYDSFEEEKWVRFQGTPIFIDGLAVGETYDIYYSEYSESDIGRASFSAPTMDREVLQLSDGAGNPISVSTASTGLTEPGSPTFGTINGIDYTIQWSDNNSQSNTEYEGTYTIYDASNSIIRAEDSTVIKSKQNWEGTGSKSAVFQAGAFLSSGERIEWSIRAVNPSFNPSPWTDPSLLTYNQL